jgi:hypothetical protein
MNINNFTEFSSLIRNSNLESISPFSNFIELVENYKTLCGCKGAAVKESARTNANNTYVRIVTDNLPNYMPHIKNKIKESSISFYNEGVLIKTY